jgi:hypothetical protein
MDVTTNAKSMLKMQKECGRVKKILSANNVVNFAVEYLMNDTDCKGEITREVCSVFSLLICSFVHCILVCSCHINIRVEYLMNDTDS